LYQKNNLLCTAEIYSKYEQENDCEVDFTKGYDHSPNMKGTTQKRLIVFIGFQHPIFVHNSIQDYMVPTLNNRFPLHVKYHQLQGASLNYLFGSNTCQSYDQYLENIYQQDGLLCTTQSFSSRDCKSDYL